MAGKLSLKDIVARFIVKHDRKGVDDAEKDISGSFDRITGAAKKVGIAIAGAFTIKKVWDFVKGSAAAAAESEAIWNRLSGAINRTGANYDALEPKIKAASKAMLDLAGIGDEAFAAALENMVGKTNDLAWSLKQMPLAADVAAKFFGGDMVQATDALSMAYNGQYRALRPLIGQVTTLEEATRLLGERSRDAAKQELNEIQGRVKQLGEVMGDTNEAFGNFIFRTLGGEQTSTAMNRFKLGLQGIAEWLDQHRLTFSFKKIFFPDWNTFFGFGMATTPQAPPRAPGLEDNATLPALNVVYDKTAQQEAAKKAAEAAAKILEQSIQLQAARIEAQSTLGQNLAKTADRARTVKGPGLVDSLFMPTHAQLEAEERWKSIGDVAENAAMGVAGAWQDTFTLLLSGNATVGKSFATLGKGIAGALLGGLAQYASQKVAENVALSVEELAKGFGAQANPFLAWTAPLHFHAAAEHAGAAALWAVLAGASGAMQNRVAGGGRGGMSGGVPSGATDIGGRIAENTQLQSQIIIYVHGFDETDPRHLTKLGNGMKNAERVDSSIQVTRKPWDGKVAR